MESDSTNPATGGRQQSGDRELFWPNLGAVLFLALIFFLNFTARIILAPFLPVIEAELGISHTQAGFFFFLIALGYFAALMGSGFVSSRLTHRKMIVASSACVGLALLGVAFAGDLWTMRASLLALGTAAGIYIPSAIAAITALVDSRHWGKAIAIHELAPNFAFLTAPFLAEMFLRWASWRAGLALLGATSLAVSLAFARWGRGGDFPGESPASGAFRVLLSTPSFWLMLLLFGLGISSTLGIFAMLPLYLVSERRMEQSWANAMIALSRLSGPFFGFLGGWVTDKLGPRRTMGISLLFTGVATLLLGPVPTAWIVLFVFFQPMLAVWFFPAGFAALAMITPPAARNLAVSFAVPFGFVVGGGAIPTFVGIMGDAGSFAMGFAVTGGLILAGGALAFYLKLPDGR